MTETGTVLRLGAFLGYVLRYLVVVLAALRLTRLMTTDWWGEWLVVRPAKRWAATYEQAEIDRRVQAKFTKLAAEDPEWLARMIASKGWKPEQAGAWGQTRARELVMLHYDSHDPFTWQAKLVSMFDCPFCWGFWAGLIVLVADRTLARLPIVGPVIRLLGAALALNYVVGHVSKRVDS